MIIAPGLRPTLAESPPKKKAGVLEGESSRTESRLKTPAFVTKIGAALSHYDENSQTNTRVNQIDQVVLSVDVVDVAIVGISPVRRPGIDQFKVIAAILKLRTTLNDYGSCIEVMFPAELGVESIVWNVSALASMIALHLRMLPLLIVVILHLRTLLRRLVAVALRLRTFLSLRLCPIAGLFLTALLILFFSSGILIRRLSFVLPRGVRFVLLRL